MLKGSCDGDKINTYTNRNNNNYNYYFNHEDNNNQKVMMQVKTGMANEEYRVET